MGKSILVAGASGHFGQLVLRHLTENPVGARRLHRRGPPQSFEHWLRVRQAVFAAL